MTPEWFAEQKEESVLFNKTTLNVSDLLSVGALRATGGAVLLGDVFKPFSSSTTIQKIEIKVLYF